MCRVGVKPEPKFIKWNVDAPYYTDEGVGATVAVLRDGKGTFLVSQCKFIPIAADVVTIEAPAIRDCLVFANNMGFHRVEAESDMRDVIKFCNGQTRWWDAVAAIFVECIDAGATIGKVKFKHCNRSANQAKHVLAKFSYCNKFSSSWLDDPPGCLVNKLIDDVSLFDDQ
ncbi:hypothetical protein VPH35_013115 [Triticum aestivum]